MGDIMSKKITQMIEEQVLFWMKKNSAEKKQGLQRQKITDYYRIT